MKILYELVITEETGFTATDFPDRFEILRGKGKTPLVFKPVAINLQDIYARLQEAEEQLKESNEFIKMCPKSILGSLLINENGRYFDRHVQ